MRRSIWLSGWVGFALWLSFVEPASATPPCHCPMAWQLPVADATEVPTNVRWVLGGEGVDEGSTKLVLTGASGLALALEVTSLSPELTVVTPVERLQPKTQYELTYSSGGLPRTGRVTTGLGPDEVAPEPGAIEVVGAPLDGACPSHLAARVELGGGETSEAAGWLVEILLEGQDTARTLLLPASHPVFGRMTGGDAADGQCLDNVTEADPDVRYQAWVTVLDLAGNRSETSAARPFRFAKAESRGGAGDLCMVRPASGGLAGLPLLLAGLWLLLNSRARRGQVRP